MSSFYSSQCLYVNFPYASKRDINRKAPFMPKEGLVLFVEFPERVPVLQLVHPHQVPLRG